MRYTRVVHHGRPRWARLEGGAQDGVAHLLSGSPVDGDPVDVATVPLDGLGRLPPVVPGVFYAVGLNYRAHLDRARELGLAGRPEVGYRASNALVGDGAAIRVPPDLTGQLEAEGELVAVIGAPLRRASREQARAAVFGWTIGNDVSARDWQRTDSSLLRAKNSDTFKPMGPWIETDVDPMAQTTTVRVNGVPAASFATGDMIFDPWEHLVEASRYVTFHPGDVLWLGTGAACPITAGDVVEVEITGIGTLTNPVE
ncbi:2-keto-4-pentenoate hydratase [Actinophytocola xinjiangensis]|uniref:2-keto-4-pentenoate hydratase n=1 Tax=Actinophytocola xinjiangensis TaxID=485602 RepID=A0A7Z0WL14_9PSEU|nr:fumarylacetoacetate hydrolase family protein [Actinophytocola xinjiangensis]OLF09814.1 2-keto-4-pentenoate hydratase [Actinophytocola xinjiangensis]